MLNVKGLMPNLTPFRAIGADINLITSLENLFSKLLIGWSLPDSFEGIFLEVS